MDMLSGSQISSFLSATSLMWASAIVLVMVGLVYFIKFKERHDSISKSQFFSLYVLIVVLNILEFFMNIIMQTNPPYEMVVYRIYIFIKFSWNISIALYVLSYITANKNKKVLRLLKGILMVFAAVCCLLFNVEATLENSGKFYILVGTLNDVYTSCAILTNTALLFVVLLNRNKMPKGFWILCLLVFSLYAAIFAFRSATGYNVKESVFIYSLIVLIIFNTTSNQDKEFVNELHTVRDNLAGINNRRSKLVDAISYHLGQSLNDLVLYNDDLHLMNEHSRELIQSDSQEINVVANKLVDYLDDINDIFVIESNSAPVNCQYQLNSLINDINNRILPLANAKKIRFNISVVDNSFLNYIGDVNKVEKIIINILCNAVSNTSEGQDVSLIIGSKQRDSESAELNITVKNNGTISNLELAKLNIDEFVKYDEKINLYDLKMIVSNELLGVLNSKIDIKVDESDTTYSFAIIQGLKDNVLYNSIN